MPDPHEQPKTGPSRAVAKVGMAVAGFAVFMCGWLGMRTDDWRKMLLYAVVAVGAAMVGSAFSRRAR